MSAWTNTEGLFESWDGTELFYRAWKPAAQSDRALIVIHRGHEHSGRVEDQVRDLGLEDFWAFSWDGRGHGRSPGERGHAESYYHLVRDLDAFVRYVSGKYGVPVENMAVVANSVGGVTASAWVHDYAPRIRAMVLAAPAFRIKLYIPFAVPLLRLLQKIKGKASISSYVKSKMLTHDSEQAQRYDADELITRDIAVNVLLGLHDTATRIVADAGAIRTPTLVLVAGSDWVVKAAPQKRFFESLSSPMKELAVYPGFYHAIFYEKDRLQPIAKAREFILKAFEGEPSFSSLLDADKEGYTKREYDRLRAAASPLAALKYGLQKLAMRTLGRLSQGVRLGLETGFDSGKSLDYVYENRARGITPFGRLIDRGYLDAVGWQGIRERGENLKACLRGALRSVSCTGQPVRIMDVAAGPGRYVLDTIKETPELETSALLRDRDPRNLEAGRALAAEMGLDNVTFEEGDAFDTDSLLSVSPPPNIAIVSGLYELFADNELVLASLRGVAGVLAPGGVLIYTGQPWHPQVEMIARTLVNRDGAPWIMRRRTQAEMDELVRSVGLVKVSMRIDSYGIFTVSVATKRETP